MQRPVLLTCDRNYLDERGFPLVHCPAIAVFGFSSCSVSEVRRSFVCLERALRMPQFFDKWAKIDSNPDSWTEYTRHLDGTTSRSAYCFFSSITLAPI